MNYLEILKMYRNRAQGAFKKLKYNTKDNYLNFYYQNNNGDKKMVEFIGHKENDKSAILISDVTLPTDKKLMKLKENYWNMSM